MSNRDAQVKIDEAHLRAGWRPPSATESVAIRPGTYGRTQISEMASSLANRLSHSWSNAPRRDVLWFFAAVVYFVLLGGGTAGEQLAALRAVNVALGGVLVVIWIRRASEHDAIDLAVVAGVLLYTASGLLSSSMRLSLDSMIQGLAFAALFWYARRLLAAQPAFAALIWTFGGLCIGVTAFFAIEWGAVWLEWAQLTGFREVPPLSLPLPTALYLHRHDVALFIVMLAPALLMPIGFGRLIAIRMASAGLILLVLLIDGSRTVMMSVAGAAVVAGALAIKRRRGTPAGIRLGRRGRFAVGGVALATLAVAAVGAGPLVARLFDFGTLSARGSLWSAAMSVWLSDPLSGSGPGTFLFAQFETGYYDNSMYFPRNTDGAPFMLLAETGLLGVLGLAIPLVALVRGRLRADRRAPLLLFGPAAFVLAGVGQVPADFGYLIVPALLWLAAAYPPEAAGRRREPAGRWRWMPTLVRRSSMASVLVIAVAVGCTVVAGQAYEDARRAIRSGELEPAAGRLSDAAAFDPRFALYSRALGAVQLSRSEPESAFAALQASESAEPRDPITHRLQALAHLAQGDAASATDAAARALELHASHPLHWVAAAMAATARGDDESAARHIDRFVLNQPSMMGANEWPASLGERRSAGDASRLLDDWARNAEAAPLGLQPALLAAMAQTDRHAERIERASASTPRTREALAALFACEPGRAAETLAHAAIGERASPSYWWVRLMVSRILGQDPSEELRLGLITGLDLGLGDTFASSPLEETWAYRRFPLPALSLPFGLPPEDAASGEWLEDPAAAAAAAGLDTLAECRPAT
jgi:tetratricopeptide (TPR) repeat protein